MTLLWENKNSFESKIKTNWKKFLINQFNYSYFNNLLTFIDLEYQNKIIYPKYENIFECFNYFNFEDTKVVILGQDPYFLKDMADGLAFSTNLNKIPKSLINIFKEIKRSLNIDRNNPKLSDWAEQGVLLLNTILTVEENKPLSHKNLGWEEFVKNVILFLEQNVKNVIYLLMGNNALEYKKYINNSSNILITSHPSPFSFKISFYGSDVFKKINLILEQENKIKINW